MRLVLIGRLFVALMALTGAVAKAQGVITFSNIGKGFFAPFSTDLTGFLEMDHRAQLQFSDGVSIGEPVTFSFQGTLYGGNRTIPDTLPGESVELRVVALNLNDTIVAISNTVGVILGTQSNPTTLIGLEPTTGHELPRERRGPCSIIGQEVADPRRVSGQPTFILGARNVVLRKEELGGSSAWGDLDGDGDQDIIAAVPQFGYRTFMQQSDGTFLSRRGAKGGPSGNQVLLADFDNDGDLDALFGQGAYSDEDQIPTVLWLNDGNGQFKASEQDLGETATKIHIADFDGDRDIDFMTISPSQIAPTEGSFLVWFNDGSGRFRNETKQRYLCDTLGVYSRLADINGDTYPDLLRLCAGTLFVSFNNRDGSFRASNQRLIHREKFSISSHGGNMAIGDVDEDGDLDVVVPNGNFDSTLWINDGSGFFAAADIDLPSESSVATVTDVDNDGDPDIVIASRGLATLYRHLEGCHYQKTSFPIATDFEMVDFDNDGIVDLIHQTEEGVAVLRGRLIASSKPELVDIPDTQLRKVIASEFGKSPKDPITALEMAALERLDLSRRTWGNQVPVIHDLKGIERALNLVELNLAGNASLQCVKQGSLWRLNNHSKLRTLSLGNNEFTQIALPFGLLSLEHLDVSRNRLSRLELSEDYANLETLDAQSNAITNALLSSSLIKLRQVDLSNNHLALLTLPENASNLEQLRLDQNPLKHIEMPSTASHLTSLSLSGPERLNDISFFNRLHALKTLQYSDGVFDPSIIDPLPNLEGLYLNGNQIVDFILPGGYRKLTNLRLRNSLVKNLHLPADMHALTQLDLSGTQLERLELPTGMNSLSHLIANAIPITSVSLQGDMQRLGSIDLSENQNLHQLTLPDGIGIETAPRSHLNLKAPPLRRLTQPSYWRSFPAENPLIPLRRFHIGTSGKLRLGVTSFYGPIQIERSNDLKTWTIVGTLEARFDGAPTYFETLDKNTKQGFYRAKLLRP